MFLLDFAAALLIALLLTSIFGGVLRKHRFGSALIFFFVVLLFGTWAGGVWVAPVGPLLWGVAWISFVFVGLFFALLLTALMPPTEERTETQQAPAQRKREAVAFEFFGIFFWIAIVCLIIAIITHYYRI